VKGAATDARPPTRLGAVRKILLALLLAVLSFVVLDVLFRGYLLFAGLPATPAEIRAEILDIAAMVTERVQEPSPEEDQEDAPAGPNADDHDIIHPFAGFDLAHSLVEIEREVARFKSPQGRKEFDVLVLGGSVAANFGNAATKLVVPVLREDPRLRGRFVRVLNHARGGYRQPQQVAMLSYLFAAGYQPDFVIEIDGFNEVALGLFNARKGASPIYPSIAHWGRVARSDRDQADTLPDLFTMLNGQRQARDVKAFAMRWKVNYSAVLGTVAVLKLQRVKTAYWNAYARYVEWLMQEAEGDGRSAIRGPAFDGTDEQVLDYLVDSWVASSLSMEAMCRARSIPYLHVLQPTLHDIDAKSKTEEEIRKGTADPAWIAGAAAGYPKLRAASRRLIDAGVPFADLSRLFAGETSTIYVDVCHYNTAGLRKFSAAVTEKVLATLPSE
jgi:hypothetical protein